MTEIIIGKLVLEIKRLYLPVTIKKICPNCGGMCERDLDQDCLSYPKVNEKGEIDFYCNNCDNEFTGSYILKMSLQEETDEKIKTVRNRGTSSEFRV